MIGLVAFVALAVTPSTLIAPKIVAPQAQVVTLPSKMDLAGKDMTQRIYALRDIIVTDENDCPLMASQVQAFDTQNLPALQADNTIIEGLSAADKATFAQVYEPKFAAAVQVYMPALQQRCGSDKAVQAAMMALKMP